MNIIRRISSFNIIKRKLFILHHPSKKVLVETDNYIDYVCPYNDKIKFIFSISKAANHIIYTFVNINNLENITDINYLDSYLSKFNKSLNTVKLNNPNLLNVYQHLTLKNIYRTQNEFIIYNEEQQNNNIIKKLNEINENMGRKIWKIKN